VEVGLNLERARTDAQRTEVDAVLKQDIEDLTACQRRQLCADPASDGPHGAGAHVE
jgi:hypothetical protein